SAIGDSGQQQRLIRTVLRKGFRFVAAVREEDSRARAIEPAPLAAAAGGARAAAAATDTAFSDRPSPAVLPFTNMSGDPEQEHLADGITEDIITALSKLAWLPVVARNSSFVYKGRSVPIRQLSAELSVRYVLEGSVRKSGNSVRITGQL